MLRRKFASAKCKKMLGFNNWTGADLNDNTDKGDGICFNKQTENFKIVLIDQSISCYGCYQV